MLEISNRKSIAQHSESLAHKILAYASKLDWSAGTPLRVAALAEQFRVSRTPINRALKVLTQMGYARHVPNRGYYLCEDATAFFSHLGKLDNEDETYLTMARDALQWGNGASLTIAELSKRYNKPRANIQKIVDRAALEGWLLRAAGHKWTITLGITSEDDYAKFYRFRETIEPAAILEPDYCVNETELSAGSIISAKMLQHSSAIWENWTMKTKPI